MWAVATQHWGRDAGVENDEAEGRKARKEGKKEGKGGRKERAS